MVNMGFWRCIFRKSQGKVVIPGLTSSSPELLMNLLMATDSRGRAFGVHIRAYNSALAFASLGVNLDKVLASARCGMYTLLIHGGVHHYIGLLIPRAGEVASFAQIYIHDGTPEGELESLATPWRCESLRTATAAEPTADVNP